MMIGEKSSSDLQVLLQQAEALAARRDFAAATKVYEGVLEISPGHAYTLVQLSYMHSLQGRYRMAEAHALAAAQAGICEPGMLRELLPRLRTFNRASEVFEILERMKPLSSIPIPVLIQIAAQLTYLNVPERAIEYLDEAKRGDPDYPTTLLARTQVLTYLGRFSEAEEDVARALRRAPEIAQGYWLQAALRKQTADSNHVLAIQRELGRTGRPANDVALLAFALHKELDDLGNHDEAWHALMDACRAKRSQVRYDAAATRAVFASLAAYEPAKRSASEVPDAGTPIFIVGMHRSGTTLLEQLLAGHSQVAAMGELYDFTAAMRYATDYHCKGVVDETLIRRAIHADLSDVGSHYLRSIAWRREGRRFFTDKLPSNFLNVGFIARALPSAKILHMRRDPIETCFSNLRELFSDANPYSYDLLELAEYYNSYQRLMTCWHERFPERILDVHYASLTNDTERTLRDVTDFCGVGFENGMLNLATQRRSVVTASAVQVRDKVHARHRAKWLDYEKWLKPLIEKLH